MKSLRIPLILFFISISCLTQSCIKDEYPVKGVLVNYDMRLCVCCGGFLINLDNTDTPNDDTKVVATLPSNFNFDASEFPIKVQFEYETGGGCLTNNIIVKKIKRR